MVLKKIKIVELTKIEKTLKNILMQTFCFKIFHSPDMYFFLK